jgi:hypothetical protein
MKKIKTMFIAVAGLVVMSCNTEKKETTTTAEPAADMKVVATEARTEGKSIEVTTKEVPEPVAVSFTKKYPKAERVVWMQYEPIETDDLKLDEKYYYVHYNSDGADYVSWYDNNGQWVKTSTKIENTSGLPDPVNNTIKTEYPGYEIDEVEKETEDKNVEMYEVKLKKGDEKVKLKISPGGEIIKKK